MKAKLMLNRIKNIAIQESTNPMDGKDQYQKKDVQTWSVRIRNPGIISEGKTNIRHVTVKRMIDVHGHTTNDVLDRDHANDQDHATSAVIPDRGHTTVQGHQSTYTMNVAHSPETIPGITDIETAIKMTLLHTGIAPNRKKQHTKFIAPQMRLSVGITMRQSHGLCCVVKSI